MAASSVPASALVPPLLRWAGSKRKLLGVLTPLYEKSGGRYVEPFAGSACLFFATRPAEALLADLNADLIEMYEQVRDCPDEVSRHVHEFPTTKSAYYDIRAEVRSTSPSYRAARFLYLNRFCFNGLYRTNAAGQFNVPYGGLRNGHLPTRESLHIAAEALKSTSLIADDFRSVLRRCRPGDFAYLDPPYAVSNRRIFRQYGAATFGQSDLLDLADALFCLDAQGVAFVLSYADCPEARHVFRHWLIRRVTTLRNISGFVAARRRSNELLVSNRSVLARLRPAA